MLSAGAAGTVRIDADILIPHLNVHILLDIRHDIAGDERGLAFARRVKGRDAHKPVNALL